MASWNLSTLIRTRVARHWRVQYRMWKTALDWTVWLYFIVPGLAVGGGIWLDWWREPPLWLAGLHEGWMAAPFAVLAMSGRLRVFLEDADVLFLRQRPAWERGLKAFGIAYSFGMHLVSAALVLSLLSVWMVRTAGLEWAHPSYAGQACFVPAFRPPVSRDGRGDDVRRNADQVLLAPVGPRAAMVRVSRHFIRCRGPFAPLAGAGGGGGAAPFAGSLAEGAVERLDGRAVHPAISLDEPRRARGRIRKPVLACGSERRMACGGMRPDGGRLAGRAAGRSVRTGILEGDLQTFRQKVKKSGRTISKFLSDY